MSDRDAGPPTLEMRMDDIRAVMDAAGSQRAVVFGLGDAGPLCVLFAATYRERTSALVLMNSSPRFVRSAEFPWLRTRAEAELLADEFERRWGEAAYQYDFFRRSSSPDMTDEEAGLRARLGRLSVSPGSGDGFFASFDGPGRAIACASAIVETMPELDLEVRAGLHTGECELIDGKVAGIAVHTGARVAANAQPGEVLVSSTVKDLVAGSGITFQDRGYTNSKASPANGTSTPSRADAPVQPKL
jgi:class 3 adenylate cyclase